MKENYEKIAEIMSKVETVFKSGKTSFLLDNYTLIRKNDNSYTAIMYKRKSEIEAFSSQSLDELIAKILEYKDYLSHNIYWGTNGHSIEHDQQYFIYEDTKGSQMVCETLNDDVKEILGYGAHFILDNNTAVVINKPTFKEYKAELETFLTLVIGKRELPGFLNHLFRLFPFSTISKFTSEIIPLVLNASNVQELENSLNAIRENNKQNVEFLCAMNFFMHELYHCFAIYRNINDYFADETFIYEKQRIKK